MGIINKQHFNNFWVTLTRFVSRFAVWIVLFFGVISAGSLYYAANTIGVNSQTADMFDSSLPFRQQQDRLNELFPFSHQTIVIVVEAPNPETTDSLSRTIADSLQDKPELYEEVYIPGGTEFFEKNQLLFLDRNELDDVIQKLSRSHVLFSLLAQNYSLRGLFAFLEQVISMGNEEQISKLGRIFAEMEQTISARQSGEDYTMSWQSAMTDSALAENLNRQFIQVKPVLQYNRLIPARAAIDHVRELRNNISLGKASVRITGSLAMSYEELQSVVRGTVIAGILAFVLVIVTLWFGLRSWRLMVCALLTLLAGLSLTMAFSAAAVGQLNMISIAFVVLYIGLGIDYAIHFVLKFNQLTGKEGYTPFESIRETFGDLSPALVLSTLSTAFGFYAFIPTMFDGVSELGIIAGTGMFISLLVTFTLLPTLLSLFYTSGMPEIATATLSAPFGEAVSSFQRRHTSLFRIAGILAAIGSLILLPQIRFDYNPINLRDTDTESVATMNELMASGSFTPWSVEVIADDSTSATTKAQKLRELESVGRVTTLLSFIPDSQAVKLSAIRPLQLRYANIPPVKKDSVSLAVKNQVGAVKKLQNQIEKYDKPKSESLKQLQAGLRQLQDTLAGMDEDLQRKLLQRVETGLLQTFPATLQRLKKSLQADSVSMATLPDYLRDRWVSPRGSYRIEAEPAAGFDQNNRTRRAFASAVQQKTPDATGNLITIISSGDTVVNAFIQAIIYAFIIITLLLIIYLRSFKYALYILLPIMLAGVMTTATMVLAGLQFNFANIIALPLIVGLGVDNGVHIVHRARTGAIARENLLKTTTARAVVFSSLTTLFSFGNLAFSPHTGTASMGIVLTFGLLFILFATLIVLPAFLMKTDDTR